MYTVTRQIQFPDGDMMVEISGGGFDYVNPDMLSPKYNNEGETFDDPRDATDAAIEIYNLWRKDEPSEDIYIGYGDTVGFTMPFEASCIPEIKEWSQKEYDSLDKCDWCGDILPDDCEIWRISEAWDDLRFCSKNCAGNAYNDMPDNEED